MFKMLKESELTKKNEVLNLNLKICRLPEFLIKEGKLFHSLGPETVVALPSESVLASGTYRSLSCLVELLVFSLTVGSFMYHSGYNPHTTLYTVMLIFKSIFIFYCHPL